MNTVHTSDTTASNCDGAGATGQLTFNTQFYHGNGHYHNSSFVNHLY